MRQKMATDTERASWREACEMAGPARMRLRLEHRRNEFSLEHAGEIELWLLDKEKELSDEDKKARPTETRRYTIRDWTIVAAWAGVVAAIGSTIVVWPLLIKGSLCAIDAQFGGIVRQYFPDDDPIKRTGARSTFSTFEVCAPRHGLPMISEAIGRPVSARPAYW
jgi:hypothetical protein